MFIYINEFLNEYQHLLSTVIYIFAQFFRTSYILLKCNKNEDGQFIVKGEEPAGSGQYVSCIIDLFIMLSFTLKDKIYCGSRSLVFCVMF